VSHKLLELSVQQYWLSSTQYASFLVLFFTQYIFTQRRTCAIKSETP